MNDLHLDIGQLIFLSRLIALTCAEARGKVELAGEKTSPYSLITPAEARGLMEATGTTHTPRRTRFYRGRKVFTLEHANQTLPLVSRIVSDIVIQQKKVSAIEEQCHAPVSDSSDAAEALRMRYADELEKLRTLIDELSVIGCQLKDWRRGLVDFLAFHRGRPVELCWRLGEKTIQHWHDVGAGFPCRQAIDEEFSKSVSPTITTT